MNTVRRKKKKKIQIGLQDLALQGGSYCSSVGSIDYWGCLAGQAY